MLHEISVSLRCELETSEDLAQTNNNKPVSQAQGEKLQERRVEQQVLVAFRELGEARHLLCPAADYAHGAHE